VTVHQIKALRRSITETATSAMPKKLRTAGPQKKAADILRDRHRIADMNEQHGRAFVGTSTVCAADRRSCYSFSI